MPYHQLELSDLLIVNENGNIPKIVSENKVCRRSFGDIDAITLVESETVSPVHLDIAPPFCNIEELVTGISE